MINIDAKNGIVEDFTIVLSDRDYTHKGQIINVDDFHFKGNLNSAQELSFTVYKELDEKTERLWDDIIDLRLIWVKELNEYFEINISLTESTHLVKQITGKSLCEAELSQSIIRSTEINTEDDITRDDYVVTKFFNTENRKGSLLHRVLEKVPHYSIKHVDSTLVNLQRTFSIDGTRVYDFLIGECSEQFGCLFKFDSTDRSISVFDLNTVCNSCGYRGEYNDICPKCGSSNLKYYGDDTTIFVSSENLTDNISLMTDVDSVKNCFKLESGDENMDAAIIASNPNGSPYVYYYSEDQRKIMPTTLVEKLDAYNSLVNSYTDEYKELSEEYYDCIDQVIYYTSGMMPSVEIGDVTANTEASKLSSANLSPIGLTVVNSYTSTATVNSALKNYARVFVKTGYVKVEVDTGTFTYVGTDANGYNYGNWVGRFKVTNYSDEEDVAYSDTITVRVINDYNYYLAQKIKKNIANDDSDDGSIYDVLSISNLESFKDTLTYYCYNRLESFSDAIQGVIDILIEENQSNNSSEYYNQFYFPYYNKLVACQNEMNVRSATIQSYENRETEIVRRRNEIQQTLNLQDYLGDDFPIFCSYCREDTYRNDNFISDRLSNTELFERASEFIELANQEIIKSGECQHSIVSNLYNLLMIKEFEPIIEHFELGNWLRIKIDDVVYRLRFVSYEINGKDLKHINTEFSDLTKTAYGRNDINNVIKQAQTMATTYNETVKQASKGEKAQMSFEEIRNNGLSSALVNIVNNDMEEVTYDKHGITCKSWDDITEDYSPEWLRITHNILGYTSDNGKTIKASFGKHNYYKYVDGVLTKDVGYGLTADFSVNAYHYAGQIIGGEIYSENYSPTSGTYFNLNNGMFSLAGGKMKFDGTNLVFNGVNLSWSDIDDAPTNVSAFTNDSGYTTMSAVERKGYETASSIKNTVITKEYIETLKVKAGSVDAENIVGTTISGKYLYGGHININNNFIVNENGDCTSNGDITCQGVSQDGISLYTIIKDGQIRINNIGNGTIANSTYDHYQAVKLGLIKHSSSSYPIGAISGGAGALALGITSNNKVGTYYYFNGGLNPNGYTEQNIISGTVRLTNSSGIRAAQITLMPSGSNLDSSTWVTLYNSTYGNARAIMSDCGFYAFGDLGCSGTKYRVVDTEHYGKIGMNAFETPEPYFADIGSGTISEIGSTTIFIDTIFAETIDMNSEYQVFITGSSNQIYVEKSYDCFTVYGEVGTSFDWMICSKQKDYSAVRMEKVNIDKTNMWEDEGEIIW